MFYGRESQAGGRNWGKDVGAMERTVTEEVKEGTSGAQEEPTAQVEEHQTSQGGQRRFTGLPRGILASPGEPFAGLITSE